MPPNKALELTIAAMARLGGERSSTQCSTDAMSKHECRLGWEWWKSGPALRGVGQGPRRAPSVVQGNGVDWPGSVRSASAGRARHGPCTPQELRGPRGRRAGPPDLSDPPALRVIKTTGAVRASFHNEGLWLNCPDGPRKDSRCCRTMRCSGRSTARLELRR